MLNGIGGATVAEARQRLSAAEFETWRLYRKRHGSLNVSLRVEAGAALVAYSASGFVGELSDYLPNRDEGDAAALDKAMKEWR